MKKLNQRKSPKKSKESQMNLGATTRVGRLLAQKLYIFSPFFKKNRKKLLNISLFVNFIQEKNSKKK